MIVRVRQCSGAPGQGVSRADTKVKVGVEILSAASATYRLFPSVQRVITRCSSSYNKIRLCCVLFSLLNLFSHCCSVMHLLVRCGVKADLISLLWNDPPTQLALGVGGGLIKPLLERAVHQQKRIIKEILHAGSGYLAAQENNNKKAKPSKKWLGK